MCDGADFVRALLEKKILLQIRRKTRGNRLQITKQNQCTGKMRLAIGGPNFTITIKTYILGCPETIRTYLS
jgi:hypothetical protein